MIRWMSGVTKLNRIRNEIIRETAKVGELFLKMQESKLRWCRGEGAKRHRGKLSLIQDSIMQTGKFLDNAPVGNPKQ